MELGLTAWTLVQVAQEYEFNIHSSVNGMQDFDCCPTKHYSVKFNRGRISHCAGAHASIPKSGYAVRAYDPSRMIVNARPLHATIEAVTSLTVPRLTLWFTTALPAFYPYWMKDIPRVGKSPFKNITYSVYRDVTKAPYNAKGNGVDDDTDAINRALSDGARCGETTCHSSTVSPALVYFPAGTSLYSHTTIPPCEIGDAKNPPTLLADSTFNGIAVIDSDFYIPGGDGAEWYKPVNNFFRTVRNFRIDTTRMPPDVYGTGLHWQVGQATNLINIHVEMSQVPGNKHQGIFMENGSGGFMADLSFNGGAFGMWVSNQQFTVHNVKITNAATGVYQLWNWGFTWKNVDISNCGIGFNINTGGLTEATQTAGGVLILDSSISASSQAILTTSDMSSKLGGSIVLQNVKLSGNVQDGNGAMYQGSGQVDQFIIGNVYHGDDGTLTYTHAKTDAPQMPESLLGDSGVFFRTRPQYERYSVGQFASARTEGAVCDGSADDSDALQRLIDKYAGCRILYIDAGVCRVTRTIKVPPNTIIVGEFWSTILADGSAFSDADKPTPVIQVGEKGDKGLVEISDIVISTKGGSAGAIGIQWWVSGDKGKVGMWDVHVRIGGAIGTNIQVGNCPAGSSGGKKACQGAFLGLHVASTGSGYFENVWVWTADHDLDDPSEDRIDSYSARGILIDNTQGPVWLVGTASEHHVMYQYSVVDSYNVYGGLIQTETPYYQPVPDVPSPFTRKDDWHDPGSWDHSGSAWALHITGSSSVYIYGAGLYSFFDTLSEACKPTYTCQKSLAYVDSDSAAIHIYQLATIGAGTMITVGDKDAVKQADNRNGFQATVSKWTSTKLNPNDPPQGPDDGPPTASGWCTFHITQYQKPNPASDPYKFTLTLFNPSHDIIGTLNHAVGKANTPVTVPSQLKDPLVLTAGNVDADPVTFTYKGTTFKSDDDNHCKMGAYDSGNRDGDCGFTCDFYPTCDRIVNLAEGVVKRLTSSAWVDEKTCVDDPQGGTICGRGYWKGNQHWEDANILEDIFNFMQVTGKTEYENILDKVSTHVFVEDYMDKCDDAGWGILMYLRLDAYYGWDQSDSSTDGYEGSENLLYGFMDDHRDSKCGGGVYWDGARDFKNTVTNGLYTAVSAMLALRYPDDSSYLNNAKANWDWLMGSGLRDTDNLWFDGIHLKEGDTCVVDGREKYTYNQGLFISASGVLYRLTGDEKYLDEAEKTLDAVISGMTENGILKEKACDGISDCDHDKQLFKGCFMKHLMYYLNYAPNDRKFKYAGFLHAQSSGVEHFATNANGDPGNIWYEAASSTNHFLVSAWTVSAGLAAHVAAAKWGTCAA
uniref:Putative glycoside hydrolase family 55 protein n=1 Tax=Moniliophthora roreri TaxID=221103 RepID=A0A0W0EZ54_MONRR